MTDQLRRCVRSVAAKKASEAGRARPSASDLASAFAICTRSLQDKGYLVRGTHVPTLLGLQRSSEMSCEPGHAAKLRGYERELEHARVLAWIRRHQADRRALRGAANKDKPTPRLSGLSTPAEFAAALQPLRHALEDVFACDTAYGDCRPDHPSAGHCFLASLLCQDLLGGDIIAGKVGEIPHYWVRVRVRGKSAIDIDITGDQFDKAAVQAKRGALYRGGTRFSRKRGEFLSQPANKKVMKMYCTLRGRVVPVLERDGHHDIAARVQATR